MSGQRIQLSNKKGWKKPEDAVAITIPTRWGNNYRAEQAKDRYDERLRTFLPDPDAWVVNHYRRTRRTGMGWGGFADKDEADRFAIDLFRRSALAMLADVDGKHHMKWWLMDLVDKDVACWCPLDSQSCHGDVLLELVELGETQGWL